MKNASVFYFQFPNGKKIRGNKLVYNILLEHLK